MPTFDSSGGWPPGERLSYVGSAATTDDSFTAPQFRAMHDGGRRAKVTSILMAVSGKGASRSVRYYIGSSFSGSSSVGASTSALDKSIGITAWPTAGNSYKFGMEVNGAFYVGTDAGSSTPVVARFTYAECPSPPSTPSFTDIGPTTMKVNWSPPTSDGGSSINGYTVQIAEESSFSVGLVSIKVGSSARSQVFNDLTPNKRYYARVLAHNEITDHFSGYGPTGPTGNASTSAGVPTAPPSVTASVVSSQITKLDWTVPASNGGSAITEYEVEYSQSPTFASGNVFARPGLVLTWTSPSLAVGTWYFRVRALNANGYGAWSTIVSNVTSAVLGLIKVQLSGAMTKKPMKVYVGGSWVQKPMKVYTGGVWKTVN